MSYFFLFKLPISSYQCFSLNVVRDCLNSEPGSSSMQGEEEQEDEKGEQDQAGAVVRRRNKKLKLKLKKKEKKKKKKLAGKLAC